MIKTASVAMSMLWVDIQQPIGVVALHAVEQLLPSSLSNRTIQFAQHLINMALATVGLHNT